MDTVPVSLEVLGGILAKNPSELQSALLIDKDGTKVPTDQTIIDKFVTEATRARLTEMKGSGTSEASSFGKKTAFEEVEKYLHDNFGIQTKGGEGAYKKAISEAIENAKTKAQTSEEAVKASEHYKEAISKLEAKEKELTNTKTDFRNRIVKDKFSREVQSVLSDKSLSLALPDNDKILGTQIEAFSTLVSQKAHLQMNDDGVIVPVDSNGKQLEDQNFNPVTLKNFITNNAKEFWPIASNGQQRQAPPAGQTGAPGSSQDPGNKFPKWKSDEEFAVFVDKAQSEGKDSVFLKEALVAYESQTSS